MPRVTATTALRDTTKQQVASLGSHRDLLGVVPYGTVYRAPTLDDTFVGGSQTFDTSRSMRTFGSLSTGSVAAVAQGQGRCFRQDRHRSNPVTLPAMCRQCAGSTRAGNCRLEPNAQHHPQPWHVYSPLGCRAWTSSLELGPHFDSNNHHRASANDVLKQLRPK